MPIRYTWSIMVEGTPFTDDDVVRAVAGDSDARERIAAVLSSQVRLMIVARLGPGSPNDVLDDIAQTAMIGLTDALGSLKTRTVGGLRAFFSTIVSRRVADHLRQRRQGDARGARPASLDSTVAGLSGAGPLWQFLSQSGRSPLSSAALQEQMRSVLEALANLKEEHRAIITYAFFDQLSTGEIAELMEISRPAASMLLIRAIKTLRRAVTGNSQVGQHGDAQTR